MRSRLEACKFLKKRLQYRRFPVKFTKYLKKPIFTEHLRWLLLKILARCNWGESSPDLRKSSSKIRENFVSNPQLITDYGVKRDLQEKSFIEPAEI